MVCLHMRTNTLKREKNIVRKCLSQFISKRIPIYMPVSKNSCINGFLSDYLELEDVLTIKCEYVYKKHALYEL